MKALDSGKLNPEFVLESEARIHALKKEYLHPYKDVMIADVGRSIGIPEHQALIDKLTATTAGTKPA
jgi:hypothetical protein